MALITTSIGADWRWRPVMVWGMQKTGSSLLLSLLDGHPELVCYPDEFRIKYFLNRGPWASEAELRAEYLRQVWKGRAVNGLLKIAFNLPEPGDARIGGLTEDQARQKLDIDAYGAALREALAEPVRSVGDLFYRDAGAFYSALRDKPESPRAWLFKMVGGNPSVGDSFLGLFVEAKIVYIVRDPRGGLSSRLKDWEQKGVEPTVERKREYLTKYCEHYESLKSLQGRYSPSRLKVVRYEDMVTDTREQLRLIGDFIGVSTMPDSCLTPSTLGIQAQVWNARQSDSGVFNSSAEEWRSRLPQEDRELAESICGRLFEKNRFGYSPGTKSPQIARDGLHEVGGGRK